MSIGVVCSCGKQLAVGDELAGKKARCPACKNVVDIPAANIAALPVPAQTASAAITPPARSVPSAVQGGASVNASPPSGTLWFYAKNGQTIGPVNEQSLQQMAQLGHLAAHDMVWKEGDAARQPAAVAFPAYFVAKTDAPLVVPPKTKTAYFLFCMFLGWAGAHSFYIGRTGKGVAQLLIFLLGSMLYGVGAIVVGIWIFIDALDLVNDRTVDSLGRPLVNAPKKSK